MRFIMSTPAQMTTAPMLRPTKHSWRRRKFARPQEIATAALAAFADNGYAAATMADIAARAGITKGTIYLYFPNKEELFNALVQQHITDKLAIKIAPLGDDDSNVVVAIQNCFDVIADIMLTDEALALCKIITSEARSFPRLAQFWRTEVIDRLLLRMTALLERATQEGVVGTVEPKVAALLCLAPAMLSLVWRSIFDFADGVPCDPSSVLQQQRSIIIQGLLVDAPKAIQ
jgi:AcrR family transcriptional regulator